MAASERVIADQLEANKVKRDDDVIELYISNKELNDVSDLSRFKNLQRLWLSGNKLRRIKCLQTNFRITELYLQNNQLVEITGALHHLDNLQTLMLHNNQLTKLERVIKELNKMQDLKVLNLFNNPVAQESEYRLYTIHHIPSLELLDRHEVLTSERVRAKKLYDQVNESVRDTIAFGRRTAGDPGIFYPSNAEKLELTKPEDWEVGNNFYRNHPPFENPEDAVNTRLLKKSVMQYSSLDWSKVPRSDERRMSDQAFGTPQIVTVKFR
ncbi:leucine-rich repeat-containing protein 72-like [Lineus longissimus]|uniref:leucine-rich repeat-containing protein 72-like n=1 Tax=Lineus longissimus TaxID=88925 RepID=UPI002B4C708A